MKKYYTYLFWSFFLGGLYSCANVLPLTGGEEDMIPPKVKKMEPPDSSLNNRSKKIIIEFDEFVVIKEANKNILISPPGTHYEVLEKGKKIQLTITDTLRENTTYVINFGNAVADNNRGNVLSNLVYTFSTGPYLDSLTTSYLVLDAFSLKPAEGIKVMLYESDTDSLPLTRMPYYAGTTGGNGMIKIGYMKPGMYKVFALKDENNSYTYDKANESIGFLENTVAAGDSLPIRLLLFKEEPPVAEVKTVKTQKAGVVCFKFTGKIYKDQFRLLQGNIPFDTALFELIGEKNDSAVFWYKPVTYLDTLMFEFTDTFGNKDTLKTFPRTLIRPSGPSYTLKITNSMPVEFDYFKPLDLLFSAPVDSFGYDTIVIREDGKLIQAIFIPSGAPSRRQILDYSFKEGKTYTVYFPKSSVKDILGNYIDSTVVTIKTTTNRKYKTFVLNMYNPEFTGAGILELLNEKDEVLERKNIAWADTNTVVYEKIQPGNYRLRLIYDTNESGNWNTGNYQAKVQPEKVVYFPQNIEIKALFDLTLAWDITAPAQLENEMKREE